MSPLRVRRFASTAATIAGLLAACAPPAPAPVSFAPVSYTELADWSGDNPGDALAAFRRSCTRLAALPPGTAVGHPSLHARAGDWRGVCREARRIDTSDRAAARRFFETRLTPHRVEGPDGPEGLFTGYFEAELRGARKPTQRYRIPLYKRPDDLISVDLGTFRREWDGQRIVGRVDGDRLVPYPARAEIDGGALAGRGLELLWVDDPVDAFFLHIQGSGRVVLADGETLRVGFDGRNGHAYTAIGRELIRRGAIPAEDMSMQAIRAWLAAHPAEAPSLMAMNESYIFFRAIEGPGPIGAQGVVLTSGRSLAVDPRFIPLGAPLWLETTDPREPSRPLRRLVVAQDTGSAITGAVRGDLFWGSGDAAAAAAGAMKQPGRYYLLLPFRVRSE